MALSVIRRLARAKLPFDHWSASKISSYLRCPRRFRYEYLDQVEPEQVSMALLLGSAVHGAVAFLHARRDSVERGVPEDVFGQFQWLLRESVKHALAPVAYTEAHPDLDSYVALGRSMLKAYMLRPTVPRIVEIEREVSVSVPGAVLPLVGFIDRIDEIDAGLLIVELKTAGKAWSQAEANLQQQITAYWFALTETGHAPVGCRFEVLTKTKQPKLQILETTRSPHQLAQFVELVSQVERGVAAGVMPRHQTPQNCLSCPFRRRCHGDSGRPS